MPSASPQAASCYEAAMGFASRKDWTAAIHAFREAIKIDPTYVDAHYDLARVLVDANHQDEAVAAYDTLLGLVPQFAEAHSERGLALATLNRHEEALAAYRHAHELKPESSHTSPTTWAAASRR